MPEGGCACGAARFRVKGLPQRTSVCHCKCGTTLTWTLEVQPGLRGVAAGTFDDTSWLAIERHSWTRSTHHWVEMPPGVAVFEKSSLP